MPQAPKYGPASNMLEKTGKRLTRYKRVMTSELVADSALSLK